MCAVPYLENGEFKIRVVHVDKEVKVAEDVEITEIELNELLNIDDSTYPN